jgi:hypothetical protein
MSYPGMKIAWADEGLFAKAIWAKKILLLLEDEIMAGVTEENRSWQHRMLLHPAGWPPSCVLQWVNEWDVMPRVKWLTIPPNRV